MRVGYRRVSSIDQNLDRQDLGDVEKVFEEKISGKDRNRTALAELIQFVREGDVVVIHSIDRLARDLRDLQSIIQELNDKSVTVEFLTERLTFSGADDPFSKLQLQMMGAFAEFERNIIKKRQAEGIAQAKLRGVYKGRQKKIDDGKIIELTAKGHSQNQVAEMMGITRMSVYRCLKANRSTKTSDKNSSQLERSECCERI